MKLRYYPETDSLYIELKPEPGAKNREVGDGVVANLDAKGEVVASTSIMPRRSSICGRSRRRWGCCYGRSRLGEPRSGGGWRATLWSVRLQRCPTPRPVGSARNPRAGTEAPLSHRAVGASAPADASVMRLC